MALQAETTEPKGELLQAERPNLPPGQAQQQPVAVVVAVARPTQPVVARQRQRVAPTQALELGQQSC